MTTCRDVDRLVTPFVDGEALPDERAEVAAHMDGCAPCHDRVAVERAARDVLRARAGALKVEAPAVLVARCAALGRQGAGVARTPSRMRRWVPLSMAATLLLAIAGVFTWGLYRPVTAVATQLTLDHMKCFAFVGGPASHQDADALAVAADLEKACGRPIPVPGGSAALGLRLVGARRCFTTAGAVAHLLYDHRGQPLSIFLLPGGARDSRGAENFEIMKHDTALWTDPGMTYAVVAAAPVADLAQVVAHAQEAARRGDR